MNEALDSFVADRLSSWITLRRDLHRHPELGFMEFRTGALIAERLHALGYDVRVGAEVMHGDTTPVRDAGQLEQEKQRALTQGAPPEWLARMNGDLTAVVGQISRGKGPTVAFRFDMDALPLDESSDSDHRAMEEGYASRNAGIMHACAHDGHTAIGIGVAEWLVSPASSWRGTVKLIFQPAEETGLGARSMVSAGVVDEVDFFYAAHLGCELDTGVVAAAATHMLHSRKFDVMFTGFAAHAAGNPHQGRNALLAGAAASINLHGVARYPMAETHINVGRFMAGTARNAVPGDCTLVLEIRGETLEATDYLEGRLRDIVAGAAAMYGVDAEIVMVGKGLGGKSDSAASSIVARVAQTTSGVTQVLPTWSLGGSDDAAHFMKRVQEAGRPAAYFLIGSKLAACHHSTLFDFDEDAIAIGVKLYAGLAAATMSDEAAAGALSSD